MTLDVDAFPPEQQDRLLACIDLVQRTGAQDFQIRYSDDEKPVVWMALASYRVRKDRDSPTMKHWEVGASLEPDRAAWRLVENLVDGGACQHCKKPTGVTAHWDEMPLDTLVCWYQYDPETKKFRRGCE